LVCDEPTSALDVSVQAQVLNLMRDLQRRLGLTYLFINHNLAVVRHMADRPGIMYLGRIVEQGPAKSILEHRRHPDTRLPLDAILILSTSAAPERSGRRVAQTDRTAAGCAFHARCSLANERCKAEKSAHVMAGEVEVACHALEEGRDG
jgi:peptide/nickel transport system ATP-binding protein